MKKSVINKLPIIMISLIIVVGKAWGKDEPLTYDRINISANATTQVENDTLIAILYYQREGTNLAHLANEVNEKITDAVKASKKVPNVEIQTPGYQSSPVYEKQRLTGWRVRQSIRLESQDTVRLGKLIGELQNTLALDSINYSVSPGKRQEVEEKLIAEAIDTFKKRSLLITHQFGRTTFRVVEMSINTAGMPPIRPMRLQAAAMAMDVTPPTIETGKQDIQVNINAMIELQLD